MNTSLMMMPGSIIPEQSSITLEHSNLAQGSSELAAHKDISLKTRRSEWKQVPLEQLRSGSDQPRRTYDSAALAELTQSVQDHGILQPILVRPVSIKTAQHGLDYNDIACDKSACYEIVAGERRWWASQEAGLTQVPILVQPLSDAAAAEVSLTENLQREDLTPLEIAQALVRMTAQGYSVRKLAARLGKQKGWVEQHLLLARLPRDLQMMLSGRPDTLTHARELEKVTDPTLRANLITRVLDRNNPLSLSALRQLIKAAQKDAHQEVPGTEVPGTEVDNVKDNPTEADDPGEDVDAPLQSIAPVEALSEEASVEVETLFETEIPPETDILSKTETAPDGVSHQEGLMANLLTTQKRLPHLPAPTDPARRQEMVAMLAATRDAIALTLMRWGVKA